MSTSTPKTTEHLHDLAEFISASPSAWHAAEEVARRLSAVGFTRITSGHEATPGKNVLVRDGAVMAWIAPETATDALPQFRILGAHTDSPTFRVKPSPDTTGPGGWNQVGVEVYGGPLANSWLDRDLAFAGRLITDEGATHLVHTDPIARIPQLAIHLDRSVNEGLKLDRQRHLHPVIGHGYQDFNLLTHLADIAGIDPHSVTGADIVMIDTQPAGTIGVDKDFFAAGRLDNLASVHSGLVALENLASNPEQLAEGTIPLLAAWDHEEVGSQTRTGAGGPMLNEVLGFVATAAGASPMDTAPILNNSWLLSADCGHLVHPNYAERHDPHHHPVPNAGPMLKVNANQRYTTDGVGQAAFVRWAKAAGVPFQYFVSNNEMPCGSTIGPIAETRMGIPTVDIGIGLLSMHSAREMCGAEDPAHLTALAGAFFAGK